MGTYIIRRLLWTIALLFFITALTFLIFYILPSADPATLRAGRQGTPAAVAAIREQLGLDKPWYEQYFTYMKALVLHFDFGHSYTNDADVRTLLFDRFGATFKLVIGAAVVWFASGVLIGIVAGVNRGTWLDRLAMGSALVAISAPVYWLGLVTLFLFSSDLGVVHVFPGSGAYQDATNVFGQLKALILPWFVLAAAFAAIYARLLRSNLVEVMSEDYIRTARAKGLSERRVILRHAVRSAITPVITVLGLDVGILMGGAILTESVFNIPGIGRLSFDAIERGDLVTIQGATLFLALSVALMSLMVDIAYAFLDPRVRY